MQGTSTVTSKGQVAIPKPIRDYFGLGASDKLHFSVKDGRIVAEPVATVKEMRGFVRTKKVLSRAQMKKIIRKGVADKHASSS